MHRFLNYPLTLRTKLTILICFQYWLEPLRLNCIAIINVFVIYIPPPQSGGICINSIVAIITDYHHPLNHPRRQIVYWKAKTGTLNTCHIQRIARRMSVGFALYFKAQQRVHKHWHDEAFECLLTHGTCSVMSVAPEPLHACRNDPMGKKCERVVRSLKNVIK